MDIESDSGNDSLSTTECHVTADVFAKLRRLKIQESLLTASLNKQNFVLNESVYARHWNPDWKMYSAKLKNSVLEIKNMFEDIKIATNDSQDNFKNIDLDDVKKDVFTLDTKIKSLENFISSELALLKENEETLLKQLDEKPKQQHRTKSKVKLQNKYNEVVPSPVRVLINSPLKYSEVQKFQEFMSKSKNRYGGWNEYNHNIFVQIWNKFYAAENIESLENIMKEINSNNLSPQFMHEVNEKIPDTKSDDLLSHSKWYSEFCFLKMCQQTALDKWRDNKMKIKKRQNVKRNITSSVTSDNQTLCRKQGDAYEYKNKDYLRHLQRHQFILSQNVLPNTNVKSVLKEVKPEWKVQTFTRPTEQWINRCHGDQSTVSPFHANSNIESVQKMGIPSWRILLK